MPNGKDYIIFYMKLLLKSINTEGKLLFRGVIPYTPDMLSSITNTDIDTVRVATEMFTQLGLMEKWDDGTLFMAETQTMIGSETASAKRVRKHRATKELQEEEPKALHCNSDVIKSNTEIDIEKEKEIELSNLSSDNDGTPHKDIVEYLNQKTGKSFLHTAKATQRQINARLAEGFTVDDFKRVIDNKVTDWGNDNKMAEYLRPNTLFGTKFEGYLNSKTKRGNISVEDSKYDWF